MQDRLDMPHRSRNIPETRLRRNLGLCTADGLLATPFVLLMVPGNIFLANFFSGVLGLRETLFGIIVSLPAWANAIQALAIPSLTKRWNARALTVYPGFLAAFIWCGFAIGLNWLPIEDVRTTSQFVFFIFLGLSVAQAINGVSWTAWIQDWIPGRTRARYFGHRNQLLGFVTVGFTACGGLLLNLTDSGLIGYQILFASAGLMRLASMIIVTRINDRLPEIPDLPDAPPPRRPKTPAPTGGLRSQKGFISFVVFASLLTFGLNIAGPFNPIYMAAHLDFPIFKQSILVVLANLTAAFSAPWWGRLIDRYGHKNTLTLAVLAWMLGNYNWVWISQSTNWMLFPIWLWGGMFSAGVILGSFNLLLRLTPVHLKTLAVSTHLAATSVLGAIAPILAGAILQHIQDYGVSEQNAFRLLFFLHPTIVIGSLLLLQRVPEPQAARLPALLGAFRSVRQAFIQSGTVFLANANMARPLHFLRHQRALRQRLKRRREWKKKR